MSARPADWDAWADEAADGLERALRSARTVVERLASPRLLPGSEDRCGGCGRVLDCCGNCGRCGDGRDRTGWQQAGRYEVLLSDEREVRR